MRRSVIRAVLVFSLASGTGAALGAASSDRAYIVWIEGGVTKAAHSITGPVQFFSATDPAGVIQSCIDSFGSAGGSVTLRAGFYPFQSVVRLPPGAEGWLTVAGEPGVNIKLSASAPSAFRFHRTADHQEFRRIRLEEFTIDASEIGGREGAVILSSVNSSVGPDRRNRYDQIVVRNIRAENVLTDPDVDKNHRGGISITSQHVDNDEPIGDWIKRILIENISIQGGNWGVLVTAGGGHPPHSINVLIDDVTIRNCVHEQEQTGRGFASSNFHVGSIGKVGLVRLEGLTGKNAADDCIEVNNADTLIASGIVCEDPFIVGWAFINFSTRANPAVQRYIISNSQVRLTANYPATGVRIGWSVLGRSEGRDIGEVVLDNCSYVNESSGPGVAVQSFGGPTSGWKRLVLRNFSVNESQVKWRGDGPEHFYPLYLLGGQINPEQTGGNGESELLVDNLSVDLAVERQGSGPIDIAPMVVGGTRIHAELHKVSLNLNLTGDPGAGSASGIWLGVLPNSTIRGGIDGLTWIVRGTWGGRARPLRIDDSSILDLTAPFWVRNADFSGGSPGTEDIFWGPRAENRDRVFAESIRWNKHDPFAVADGALQPRQLHPTSSPLVYHNVDLVTEDWLVHGGEVDRVEYSRNGAVWLDTGMTGGALRLAPGDSVRITFSKPPEVTIAPAQ